MGRGEKQERGEERRRRRKEICADRSRQITDGKGSRGEKVQNLSNRTSRKKGY